MEFLDTASFKSFNYYEGVEEVPRAIVTFEDSRQYGFPAEIKEIEVEGYRGFIDRVLGRSIYMKMVDPTTFLKFESKYLGSSLKSAFQSLNLKEVSGEFPDIHQDFYMIRESPWDAFIRLSRYLPETYYAACLGDKIKIFKVPDEGDYLEIQISDYTTESNYNRYSDNMVIKLNSDSKNGNPNYTDLKSIPISRVMLSDVVKSSGTSVLNNYLSRYKNRDAYYPENLIFQSGYMNYEIGDGLIIGETKFMIISKSSTIGTGSGASAYRCIRVS